MHGLRSIAWVRYRRCCWSPTIFDAASACQFSCLPTLIVNEIRFLWTEAFGQAQKDRRSRRKKLCSVLISHPHTLFSLSIFRKSLRFLVKGLGTKRAYSTAKRLSRLNYAGSLPSLSACARWKSLSRLLNDRAAKSLNFSEFIPESYVKYAGSRG